VRYLIISDIHGNLEALDAVVGAMKPLGYDKILVLGDLVGYGADPNAVIDRVRDLEPYKIIRGNHDKVAAGLEDGESFNIVARSAVQWTHDTLTPANRDYLLNLPAGPIEVDERIEICHGSPFDEDAYIFDELDAVRALKVSTRTVCLFGHTHYPITFELSAESLGSIGSTSAAEAQIQLRPGCKYLINPGSVGQPRDGDPRAAYVILDLDRNRALFHRVSYPVERTQEEILDAGLPETLAGRLAFGM
jgi:putative phosphoesterase